MTQRARAGSKASGSPGWPSGRSVSAITWARTRPEYGPCNRPLAPCPVATQAFDHPGRRPTEGPVVGRHGTQAHSGLPVLGAGQARRYGQPLAQQLRDPGCGRRRRETRAALEGAPAGHPAAGPGDEVVREQRLHDRPGARVAHPRRDARSGPWSGRRAVRIRATPPSPRSRRRRRRPARRTPARPDPPSARRRRAGGPLSRPAPRRRRRARPRTRRPRARQPSRRATAMPRPSTRAAPGACSTRWTRPSGGKSATASPGPISATSPGERRSVMSAKGANHSFSCARRITESDPHRPYPASPTGRAVGRKSLQQQRVVRAAVAQERPQGGVRLQARHRRQDAGARVGGSARVPGVDHCHRRTHAGQLVGQGQADDAGADHGDVDVPSARSRPAAPRGGTMTVVERLRTPDARFDGSAPGSPSRLGTSNCPTGCACTTWTRAPGTPRRCCCCTASPRGRTCTAPWWRAWPPWGCAPSRRIWSGSAAPTSPPERTAHTVRAHVDWLAGFVHGTGLDGVTLVVQDWGGPFGSRASGGRARALPPGRRRQHRAAHRRHGTGRTAGLGVHTGDDGTMTVAQALLDYQRLTQELMPFRPSLFVQGATASAPPRRRTGGVRRAVPRRDVLRRRRASCLCSWASRPRAPAPG